MGIREKTKEHYTRVALEIRSRFTRDRHQEPETDWAEFEVWMNAHYTTLAPDSRRVYHAALIYYQSLHHPDHIPGPIPGGMPNRSKTRSRYGKRGPAHKTKNIPVEIEDAIIAALRSALQRNRASQYTNWALAFIRAGVTFGLRPCEWLRARFLAQEDGSMVLHVINAKNTGDRAFGPTRTLMLDEDLLDPQAQGAAEWLILQSFRMTDRKFDKVIENANRQLQRVIKSCGRPCRKRIGSITLYTARHQFAANVKRAKLSLVEIASLMGHASIETAAAHYGRGRYGRDIVGVGLSDGFGAAPSNRRFGTRIPVWPHPENVDAVQAIADRKTQKAAPDSGMCP